MGSQGVRHELVTEMNYHTFLCVLSDFISCIGLTIKFVKFIIVRTWKQPRCPSTDKWMRKLWYIYTMEYYSAIKKNVFESILMRWMKLEHLYKMK